MIIEIIISANINMATIDFFIVFEFDLLLSTEPSPINTATTPIINENMIWELPARLNAAFGLFKWEVAFSDDPIEYRTIATSNSTAAVAMPGVNLLFIFLTLLPNIVPLPL